MRHVEFQADAFNRMFPASYAKNMVFAPASFEIDCAVWAESLDTIPKAKISEMLGVTLDFESTFRPIIQSYSSTSNGLSCVSARGFCVGELRKTRPAHCLHLERVYDTEVMRASPKTGPETWFRTSMDGEMDDFELPSVGLDDRRYAYYDLVSIDLEWAVPFPVANTRKGKFTTPGGETVELDFLSDVREVCYWEHPAFTMLRLPIRDESALFLLVPKAADADFTEVRKAFTSARVDELLLVSKSLTAAEVFRGPMRISFPSMEIDSSVNLVPAMQYFRIPLKGLSPVTGDASLRECRQRCRFRLAESGRRARIAKDGTVEGGARFGIVAKEITVNRPFLFFVYCERTETVAAAGQFTGRR